MDLFLVYAVCLGVGLLFTIVSAFMSHVFGGHDVGHDAHSELGTGGHAEAGYNMPGFSPFSPTVIASFVTAFGGFGMIFSKIESTKNPWISAPLAVLSGLLIAAGVFWMFHQLFSKTQSSSESQVTALIGATATVITPIPAHGVGEIAYVDNGTRYTAPARVVTGVALPTGQTVTISKIVGSQFYVEAG
jgi:amino acid transporter